MEEKKIQERPAETPAEGRPVAVRLSNVTKRFGEFAAVDDRAERTGEPPTGKTLAERLGKH